MGVSAESSTRNRSRSSESNGSASTRRKRLRPSSLERDDKSKSRRKKVWDDYNGLAVDEADSIALSKLQDFEKEAELARRHDKRVCQRQREELLSSSATGPRDVVNTRHQGTIPEDRGSDLDISEDESSGNRHFSCDERRLEAERDSGRSGDRQQRIAEAESTEELFRREEHQDGRGVEAKRLGRRLEKAISLISGSLLESIRLSQKRIREMQEHPQVASYLQGCLVRIPNIHGTLSSSMSEGAPLRRLPPFIAARILSLDRAASNNRDAGLFDLEVSPLSGGSRLRIAISEVSNEPFDDDDVAELQSLLRSRTEVHEFAESLPHMAKRKAQDLRDFTFTETDVAEILERKRQQQNSVAPSYQACYQRRADVETKVEQLKTRLQSSSLSRDERKTINSQLKSLEVELYSLNRQVDTFRSARLLDKEVPSRRSLPLMTATKSKSVPTAGGGLFICGGGGGRGSLKETLNTPSMNTFDRSPLAEGSQCTPITRLRQITSATSSGPEVTLRILAAVEATSRDGDQNRQQQPNSLTPKAKLALLISDASVAQHIHTLKTVLETHKQYWHIHSPPCLPRIGVRFPPLLKKAPIRPLDS